MSGYAYILLICLFYRDQCWSWSGTAFCSVWYGSALFVKSLLRDASHKWVNVVLQLTHYLSRDMTKPTKWVCPQRRLRSDWAFAQSDQSLCCPHEESLGPYVLTERTTKLWSGWANVQADLSLRWAHTHSVGLVISWLTSVLDNALTVYSFQFRNEYITESSVESCFTLSSEDSWIFLHNYKLCNLLVLKFFFVRLSVVFGYWPF